MCAIKSFLISLGVEFHPSGHRTWSEEAKAHLVAQTLEPGATVKAVAERYGVLANQLSAWRRAAKDGMLVLPSGAEDEAVFAPLVICDPEEPEAKPDSGTEPPRLFRRVSCSTTRRPYRVTSGLHRMLPLLQRVECIRWVPASGGRYTNRPI